MMIDEFYILKGIDIMFKMITFLIIHIMALSKNMKKSIKI